VTTEEWQRANEETREAWDENAAYWDERIAEGNDFVELLIWPATQRLLALRPGDRVLDAACGNGLYARKLAAMGAEVVAFDFSPAMIQRARQRTTQYGDQITYHVLDATDETALLALGPASFDAVLCNMALFDIAEIRPLIRATSQLLRPGGAFLFSVIHPCFNSPRTTLMAELEDRDGQGVMTYSVKVSKYLTPGADSAAAILGQPKPQLIFHRPLQVLLGACFEAGFVMDALEERAFPPDHPPGSNPLSWSGKFSELPPVLIVRMRHVT
jgi:2-polyprenyl-3-methyl-5-hydroxy-6-metoxy-1,4-benzoquinol methylase